MRWLALMCGPLLIAAVPNFDPSALLRQVLIPADAAVGSIIYRLRATDPTFDFPLKFTVQNRSTVVDVESLNCTRFNSVCQANVVLQKRLEIGRFYDFTVLVQSKRGESASLNCSFRATNATTPIEKIFPGAPTLIMVSEKSRRNTELGTILAKGNPNRTKAVLLELWGSTQFGLHQRLVTDRDAEGTILLLNPLDYETRTVHHLTVLANDPWTEMKEDTRNIAGWPLLVAVMDEQDTPPVFTIAPPTTILSPSLQPGDVILKVHAEDGDRGNPREIRYGLLPEGNPFASFFEMSEETGELKLSKPLRDIFSISHSGQPILLNVIAEEVRSNPEEAPSQSTTVRLALIPPGVTAGSPTFGSLEYNALLDENSPTGTILDLAQAEINTQPGDVVTLEMQNNNNTFDISPGVVEGHAKFQISVHDPRLLDYEERHSVQCFIVAKEIGSRNFTAKVKLTVLLNDVNDNPPEFVRKEYVTSVSEHADIGTTIIRVEAHDLDSAPDSRIKYTKISGPESWLFHLEPDTGVITVLNSEHLDAETFPNGITVTVEATDDDGKGLSSTATVLIKLNDINDHAPECGENFEFIVSADKTGFTSDAIVKVIDKDLTSPNNEVHYEIYSEADPSNNLQINPNTGRLTIRNPWSREEVYTTSVRAWDGGVPRKTVTCKIRIYPPDGQTRRMEFIVPGINPDREKIAKTLRALTGGLVRIDEVRPYTKNDKDVTDISGNTSERSVIVATVRYSKNAIIDVDHIQKILENGQNTNVYRKQSPIRRSSSSDLLWIIILLIIIALIIAIILILCCLWSACPMYIPPKKRQIHSAEIVEKLVVKGSSQGRESKSVQVAEWFGRKEAWSPEPAMIDAESESLRRHEMERGSDGGGLKRGMQRQPNIHREPSREQLYIREGNTDILRLITRGGELQQQRPVTLITDQAYLGVDSGKDILMRRYIDQQQSEALRASQNLHPHAVNRLQTEQELLEASLRQQNALLRQIILERERDFRLETQSLPAGTQTDQDAGTQTEPLYLRPPRREVQSDNDASDQSDDEMAIIKERIKRRNGRKMDRSQMKRKIKTPIQEESEVEMYDINDVEASERPHIKQTRTSELRQKRSSSESHRPTKSALRKEVLREISMSLDQSEKSHSEASRKGVLSTSMRRNSTKSSSTDSLGRKRKISTDQSEADLKREILRKISVSLDKADDTNSVNEADVRNEILNEISDTIKERHKSISESELKDEIVRKISQSLERSDKSVSSSSHRSDVLRKISDALDSKLIEQQTETNQLLRRISASLEQLDQKTLDESKTREMLRKISASLENHEDLIDHPNLRKEIIRQMTVTLEKSKSSMSESEMRDEIMRRLSIALDKREIKVSEDALKEEVLRKVSASLDSAKSYDEKRRGILREISISLDRNDKLIKDGSVRRDVLRQVTLTLEQTDKTLSEAELRSEILRRVSAALDRNDVTAEDEDTKEAIMKKVSNAIDKSQGSQKIIKEVATTFDHPASDNDYQKEAESFSEDSLEDISPRSDKTTDSSVGKARRRSKSDVRQASSSSRKISFQDENRPKSKSQSDINKSSSSTDGKSSKRKKKLKRVSRYMEWYDKQKSDTNRKKSKSSDDKDPVKETNAAKESLKTISGASKSNDSDESVKRRDSKKSVGPEHPLLQHSERRFEANYPQARRPEEDNDSGIALTRPPMAQKKSVFTIAYDDMHTSQLRPDSTTPPL